MAGGLSSSVWERHLPDLFSEINARHGLLPAIEMITAMCGRLDLTGIALSNRGIFMPLRLSPHRRGTRIPGRSGQDCFLDRSAWLGTRNSFFWTKISFFNVLEKSYSVNREDSGTPANAGGVDSDRRRRTRLTALRPQQSADRYWPHQCCRSNHLV